MTTAPVQPNTHLAHTQPDRTRPGYKLTPLGWIPTEWEVVKLGDILSLAQYGLSIPTTFDGMYPMFKMNNFERGKMSPINVDKVSLEAV